MHSVLIEPVFLFPLRGNHIWHYCVPPIMTIVGKYVRSEVWDNTETQITLRLAILN